MSYYKDKVIYKTGYEYPHVDMITEPCRGHISEYQKDTCTHGRVIPQKTMEVIRSLIFST